MKKLLTAKSLSFFMLLSLLGGKVEANRHFDNDGYVEERGGRDCGSCFSCYECGCNPLYCGAWDLQVQGGVDPIIWRNTGDWLFTNTSGAIAVAANGPKFNHLFKTPWVVGGQVGYHMSDNTRVYVEFNYIQANAKSTVALAGFVAPITALAVTGSKYKLFDGYVGARYYWDRWCDRVAFFLGAKVGFTHHKRNNFALAVTPTLALTDTPVYNRNTVVAGGADFGLDFCFCGNWSFVITGAVLASCGPRAAAPFAAVVSTVTNIIPGGIGTELRFPVTAGVRYSF